MRTDIHIGFFDLFIFLGVFQGIFLAWFFIKNGKQDSKANLYQGLLLLFLSMGIFEELLNNTGYIVMMLPLTNFAEALSFTFGPLYYLYIRSSLYPGEKKKTWIHFVIAGFWMVYLVFHFIQPDELKYNSYVQTKHPDWPYLSVDYWISDDPLRIRWYTNELLAFHFTGYMIASIIVLLKAFRALQQPLLRTENSLLAILRNTTVHFIIIILVFLGTKLYYGMGSDIGGALIAAYISFMIFATSYQVLNRSDFFMQPQSFMNFPARKYTKSSLSEADKDQILEKIRTEMETELYFTQNLASLSGLSKKINASSHHVSQVINEKLGKNFFELLAGYRVEHAMKLMQEDPDARLTVEELAEQVGYNSKSSFNTAFKKLTAKTPSEYRKSLTKS